MPIIQEAQLLTGGESQVVQLPDAFHFEGTHVRITKIGDSVVLSPLTQDRWDVMTDALAAFEFEPDFVLVRPKPMPQAARDKHPEDTLFTGIFRPFNRD